jgi:hypothetical protein
MDSKIHPGGRDELVGNLLNHKRYNVKQGLEGGEPASEWVQERRNMGGGSDSGGEPEHEVGQGEVEGDSGGEVTISSGAGEEIRYIYLTVHFTSTIKVTRSTTFYGGGSGCNPQRRQPCLV